MRKRSNLVVIICSLLIIIGVIAGSVTTKYASEIATVATTVTAIVGALGLWIQFRIDGDLNKSSFIFNFYEKFYVNEGNDRVLDVLNKKANGHSDEELKNMYNDVITYLYWVRTLCGLIERNVLNYESIDDMFSFRFFAILNNKIVQEMEIEKNKEYYKIIYRQHRKWSAWRKRHHLDVIFPDEDLAKVEGYDVLSK